MKQKNKPLEVKHVAVGVVKYIYTGEILLLRRSMTKKTYPGIWENSGGGINEGETPEQAVLRETKEETGLSCKILRQGKEFHIIGYGCDFVVHPFLLECDSKVIKLSHEHSELTWINPKDYLKFGDVHLIEKDFESLGLI